MRSEEFQGNRALELGVFGLIRHPLPALAEFLGDLVVADGLADQDGVILPVCG